MSCAKITISVDKGVLKKVDRLVKARAFHSRSEFIQAAVREKIARIDRSRLARECSKLDEAFEQTLADQGLGADIIEWPEYSTEQVAEDKKNRLAWAANDRFLRVAVRKGLRINDVFNQIDED